MDVCNPCAQLTKAQGDTVKIYINYYKEGKDDYYVYKLSQNGDIKIVKKKFFNIVFETEIKPNFDNGAEYWHISEFTHK